MSSTKKRTDNNFARIPAVLLNIFLLPGLGTLLSGKRDDGFWQIGLVITALFTLIIGLFFTLTIFGAVIGIPLIVVAPGIYLIALVWSLISVLQ